MAPKAKIAKGRRGGKPLRSRYAGSGDELVKVLSPHVPRPCFVKYAETAENKKTMKSLIISQGHLIRAVHLICPNLSFTKTQMSAALKRIAEDKKFFEDPADMHDWVCTCTARLRHMFRDYGQALIKARGHSTSWVSMVLPLVLTYI